MAMQDAPRADVLVKGFADAGLSSSSSHSEPGAHLNALVQALNPSGNQREAASNTTDTFSQVPQEHMVQGQQDGGYIRQMQWVNSVQPGRGTLCPFPDQIPTHRSHLHSHHLHGAVLQSLPAQSPSQSASLSDIGESQRFPSGQQYIQHPSLGHQQGSQDGTSSLDDPSQLVSNADLDELFGPNSYSPDFGND